MPAKSAVKFPEKRLRLVGRLDKLCDVTVARGGDFSERLNVITERYNVLINADAEFLDAKTEEISLSVENKRYFEAAAEGRTQWEIGFHLSGFLREAGAPEEVAGFVGGLFPSQVFLLLERMGL